MSKTVRYGTTSDGERVKYELDTESNRWVPAPEDAVKRIGTNAAGEKVNYTLDKDMNKWVPEPTLDTTSETMQIGEDTYKYPMNRKLGVGRSAQAPNKYAYAVRSGVDKFRKAFGRSPAAYQRSKEAKEMGVFEKMPIALGQEMHQLEIGLAEIADMTLGAGHPAAIERRKQRALDNDSDRELFREFSEQEGVSGVIRGVPYAIGGQITGPLVEKAIGKIASGVGKGIKTASGQVLGRRAPRANRFVQNVGNSRARPTNITEGTPNQITSFLSDAVVGAGESGLHYTDTAFGGAASSAFGGQVGRNIAPVFEWAPNLNSDNLNRILDTVEDRGGDILPGMRTGQPARQTFEAGLDANDKYSLLMKETTLGNQRAVNDMVGESMGIDVKDLKNMSEFGPRELTRHMDSLKKQYNEIEDSSSGLWTEMDIDNVVRQIDGFPDTPSGRSSKSTLEGLVNHIDDTVKDGSFTGPQYKEMKKMLKNERKKAALEGNYELSDRIGNVFDTLKSSMESGIRSRTNDVTAAKWTDLDERMAITKLVMNKGMDNSGSVDLNKLGNHLINTDAERYLMEKGGRITDLFELSKYEAGLRNQQGSGLTGTGIHHTGDDAGKKKSEFRSFITTPKSLEIPKIRRALYDIYKSGYPATTGVLALPQKMRLVEKMSRSQQQGYDPYTAVGRKGLALTADAIDFSTAKFEEMLNALGVPKR